MRIIEQLIKNRDYKILSQNIFNLFIFQGTNYLLPLITIPYIVRVIGPQNFGILSFAEVINYYFILITDYGFNITGTQKISISRDNIEDRNRIFSIIFSVKFCLSIICFSILFLVIQVLRMGSDSRIFYLYFLMVPGNILLSYWFYLGMEKMHYLNFPNLLSRILYTVLVFLFLKQMDQYYLVPLFYGLSLISGGLFSIILVYKRFQFKWVRHDFKDISAYLREGWSIFISTFAINLYRKSNVFILGLVASKEAVGFYSAGEKIIIALQSIFSPVIQAFYPFISRKRQESARDALGKIKKLVIYLGGSTAAVSLLIIAFAPFITKLVLGDSFLPSATVLRIASLVIFLGVLNYIIGIIFMTNFNLQKQFSRRVMVTGVVNIIICASLSYIWPVTGTAIAFTVAELFLLFLLTTFIFRHKKLWEPRGEF